MGTRKKGSANRVAQRLGFRNDYERRKASRIEVRRALENAGDSAGLKRHDAAVEKNAQRRVAAGDAITPLVDGQLTSSGDAGVLRSAVNRAATADRHLSAVVTVLVKPKQGDVIIEEPRKLFRLADLALWLTAGFRLTEVDLWHHGGYAAELFKADVAARGLRPAFMHHVRAVMERSKYPETPVAIVHVDLTARD